jgi:DNA-binding SARP family transcriptional activator
MLGEFTLQTGDVILRESGNRSRRIFGLLSFLICHRGHPVSQYKLIELLWGDSAEVANPENTLRILLHRARNQLDQLYEGAGRACILRKDGSYCWNPEIPVSIDYERFEQLCQSKGEDRLANLLEALSLYRGEFLSHQSSDSWVVPICTHFQNLFLLTSQEAAQLLYAARRYEEAAEVCRRCLAAEPYSEPACQLLMQSLAAMNNPKAAAEVYESFSKRLFDDFGIRPSQETRSVYRNAVHAPEDRTMAMDEVLEHLQEPEAPPGALECDYDYFKMLCFAERRSMERSGNVTHVALLSITGTPEKPLSKRSRNRIMDQLGESLRSNLRRGDVISRCSASQYILLLPKANYENSCMVCRRCIAAFQRSHPHVSARINFLVQPLTPNYCMP